MISPDIVTFSAQKSLVLSAEEDGRIARQGTV